MRSMLLSAAAFSCLSACGSLVPGTLLQLNALDPFTADPAGFSVGLDMPDGLALEQGSVTWTFKAVHSPSGETRQLSMILDESRAQDGMVLYRLSPADVIALRAWQQALLPWRETSDGNSSLSLDVSAEGCRIAGTALPDDPRVSVFVQLAPEAPLRPLIREGSVSEFFDIEDLAALDECANVPR